MFFVIPPVLAISVDRVSKGYPQRRTVPPTADCSSARDARAGQFISPQMAQVIGPLSTL